MNARLPAQANAAAATAEERLAAFAATLELADIPAPVLRRAEELMIDWFGSALAGKGARPVETLTAFAEAMGPADGASEILIHRRRTSPYMAAFANAAASHFAEQDDVHNGSVFHPASVVFPPALATAQAEAASGADLLVAVVAGYEVGIRVGEFLGRSHYRTFHTTGTAGTLAAAAAVGRLLRLSPAQMLNAFGSAGTQSAGLWEFLRDGADSKQLHTAHAAGAGLAAAYLARDGFTGARRILEGRQGMAAGMSTDADPSRLVDGLANALDARRDVVQVPRVVPPHASRGGCAAAGDARERASAGDVKRVVARVHQGAIDVLGPVVDPRTVHQSKFSMGTVLGLIAVDGHAGLAEFDAHYRDPAVVAFRDRVAMELDDEVDRAYPARWIGKVTVETTDGRRFDGRVDEPKGDPGNTLSPVELEDKAVRLARYRDGASEAEARRAIAAIRTLASTPCVPRFLA